MIDEPTTGMKEAKADTTPKYGIGNCRKSRNPKRLETLCQSDYTRALTIEFMVRPTFHYLLVIGIGERAECDQPLDDAFAVF